MGVENAVYRYIINNNDIKSDSQFNNLLNTDTSYIKIITSLDERIKKFIDRESNEYKDFITSISAGCSSGIISHYLRANLKPVHFDDFHLFQKNKKINDVKNVIYTIYTDYINLYWNKKNRFTYNKFRTDLKELFVLNKNVKIYLILASERFSKSQTFNKKRNPLRKIYSFLLNSISGNNIIRIKRCNAIVRKISKNFNNVLIFEPDNYIMDPTEIIDHRHFKGFVFKRFCETITE